jgi:hypothetical protein
MAAKSGQVQQRQPRQRTYHLSNAMAEMFDKMPNARAYEGSCATAVAQGMKVRRIEALRRERQDVSVGRAGQEDVRDEQGGRSKANANSRRCRP